MSSKNKQLCRDSGIAGIQLPPMPQPDANVRPAVYADLVGEWYVALKTDTHRKEHGLYLTPPLIADFMSAQIRVTGQKLRLLDPAAGTGILVCAAVEKLVSRKTKPLAIEIVAYEIDAEQIPPLRAVLDFLVKWCDSCHNVTLDYCIKIEDFILAHAEAARTASEPPFFYENDHHNFDIVISNPPYFKIKKSDHRAVAFAHVVHGQPNIYGLFMSVSSTVLKLEGNFIFIVPRSFTSGLYFKQFRSAFFDVIRPTEVHVFRSRRDTFSRDKVLQENIVFSGVRDDSWHMHSRSSKIRVSSSRGKHDIAKPITHDLLMRAALNLSTVNKVLRLPLNDDDDDALDLVDSWPNTLHSLGLKVSTGPIVAFRAKDLIGKHGIVPNTHVPLLWMSHVKPMTVQWPLDRRRPEYIARSGAEGLLVPNQNYVLLRRFSTKEEARRITATPYTAANFSVPELGLENHLNYIFRPVGTLAEDEAWGLAALYNSRLLDTYFRAINGNTQVSATELRELPLPPHDTIITLGQKMKSLADPLEGLDDVVMRLVSHPHSKDVVVA